MLFHIHEMAVRAPVIVTIEQVMCTIRIINLKVKIAFIKLGEGS